MSQDTQDTQQATAPNPTVANADTEPTKAVHISNAQLLEFWQTEMIDGDGMIDNVVLAVQGAGGSLTRNTIQQRMSVIKKTLKDQGCNLHVATATRRPRANTQESSIDDLTAVLRANPTPAEADDSDNDGGSDE